MLKEANEIFKVLKVNINKNNSLKILNPAKLFFRGEGEIKSFSDEQKLRKFITTRSVLQEMV